VFLLVKPLSEKAKFIFGTFIHKSKIFDFKPLYSIDILSSERFSGSSQLITSSLLTFAKKFPPLTRIFGSSQKPFHEIVINLSNHFDV